jgi:lipid-A-disaccharide synthase
MVAGEASGDLLAGLLLKALHGRWPGLVASGIGGPRMQAEGCVSLYPMERLSLIGFGILTHLPGLLAMRRALVGRWRADPPDLFIGVDVPDFNLGLERRLKAAGIRTLHYVSPTVWAWRRGRIRRMPRAVDHVLALFPFETRCYAERGIPVTFVGHPLAEAIPENLDRAALRDALGLARAATVVALLPGSRRGELERHAELFVRTAQWLHARRPELRFVAPFVDAATRAIFAGALARLGAGALPITLVDGRSREAMAAADLVLLASGTATLECALLRRPMVVTYRVSLFSYLVARLFVHLRHYALPNIIAGRELVPERLQYDATPEKLGAALERYLCEPERAARAVAELGELRRSLRGSGDRGAAAVALQMLGRDRA